MKQTFIKKKIFALLLATLMLVLLLPTVAVATELPGSKDNLTEGEYVLSGDVELTQNLTVNVSKCFEDIEGKVEITDLNTRKAEGGNGYLAQLNKQEPTEQTPSKQIEQNKPAEISPQTDDISDMTFWFILAGVSLIGIISGIILSKKK